MRRPHCKEIEIVENDVEEFQERFFVVLNIEDAVGVEVQLFPATAIVKIIDDDPLVTPSPPPPPPPPIPTPSPTPSPDPNGKNNWS